VWPALARADGLSAYIEEDFTHVQATTNNPAVAGQSETDQFTQRYRLSLDRTLYPMLRFDVGGTFERVIAATSGDLGAGDSTNRIGTFFGKLILANPFLSGAAGYDYRSEKTTAPAVAPVTFVSAGPSGFLNWKPDGLPQLTLRLSRLSNYDTLEEIQDLTTTEALFSAAWDPVRQLDLRYALDYQRPIDYLHALDTTSFSQAARASYTDSFGGGATSVAGSVNVNNRQLQVTASGSGGTLATPLSPIAGWSLVETFPAIPAQDTLTTNPTLIDGNTTVTAGVNIGFNPVLGGDSNFRDLGVQFADAVTKVNTLWVWVDRQLPTAVAANYTWTAWASDDNVRWTSVGIVGPVAFALFQNRFEITIQSTQARYLKVVTKPLDPAAVTTDRARYADVFVTELQALLVVPVQGSQGWQSNTRGVVNASLRQMLTADFAYDFTTILTYSAQTAAPTQTTYFITNGLSFNRKVSPILLFNARFARQDQNQNQGHEGGFLYSASLGATPLPTLNHSLVYSGQVLTGRLGTSINNTFSLFNRATPYRGIGLIAGLIYGLVSNPAGQLTRNGVVTINATAQPHPALVLGVTYGHSITLGTGGGAADLRTHSDRVEGTATFNPFPALYLSGSVSRTVTEVRGVTLANSTISFAPFPGGALQMGVTFSQQLEPNNNVGRQLVPYLRWYVRPGTLVSVTYTVLDSSGEALDSHTRVFDANLQIAL
jgi:hypothetical protein